MIWVARRGRLVLALVTAALAVLVAFASLPYLDTASPSRRLGPAYPRIQQAAGIVDLFRRLDPALRPAALRALEGVTLKASIERAVPPEGPDLRRAPRVEEKLREFAAPGLGDGLRAYVDARFPSRSFDTEGWPARVVWPIAQDQVLVLASTERRGPRSASQIVPRPVLIGLAGVVVAGIALLLARREGAALNQLTLVATRFDGGPAAAIGDSGGPEVRRLAAAVSDMQRRVAMLLQERSFLIGAISHDLKTYLTRLRLRAETLVDAGQRDRMAGDLEAMSNLIDTSLAFARGTTLAQHMNLVDLADLVAIEAAERTALGQSVSSSNIEGDALVLGDPIALRRVLGNLVDNALKFGQGQTELAVETLGSSCRILVDDDGPGIAATERAAVFSPFYRVDSSRSRRTGGNGLGLAIARQIVEAHGGTIAADDSPLGGARVVVTLPLASTIRS